MFVSPVVPGNNGSSSYVHLSYVLLPKALEGRVTSSGRRIAGTSAVAVAIVGVDQPSFINNSRAMLKYLICSVQLKRFVLSRSPRIKKENLYGNTDSRHTRHPTGDTFSGASFWACLFTPFKCWLVVLIMRRSSLTDISMFTKLLLQNEKEPKLFRVATQSVGFRTMGNSSSRPKGVALKYFKCYSTEQEHQDR